MYPGFYGSLWKICGVIFLGARTLLLIKLTDLPKLTVHCCAFSPEQPLQCGHFAQKTLSTRGNRNTIFRF